MEKKKNLNWLVEGAGGKNRPCGEEAIFNHGVSNLRGERSEKWEEEEVKLGSEGRGKKVRPLFDKH